MHLYCRFIGENTKIATKMSKFDQIMSNQLNQHSLQPQGVNLRNIQKALMSNRHFLSFDKQMRIMRTTIGRLLLKSSLIAPRNLDHSHKTRKKVKNLCCICFNRYKKCIKIFKIKTCKLYITLSM